MQFEPLVFDFSQVSNTKQVYQDTQKVKNQEDFTEFDFWLFQDGIEHENTDMSPLPKLNIFYSEQRKVSQKNQESIYVTHQFDLPEIQKKNCKTTSKKSIHHNFQKHTVITLKKLISVMPLEFSNNQSDKLALKMWKKFMKSSEKTKQTLTILFGSYKSSDKTLAKKIKLNGFSETIQFYSEQQIQSSQDRLRILVSQQLDSIKLQKHLNYRKISNKQHFQLYLKCFCSELRDGPLNQRLKKQKAQIIQSVLDTDKYFSF